MKARIWVSTYRRPELLPRCLTALEKSGLEVVVLYPFDEEHEFPNGVIGLRLPCELSGTGTGGPRTFAGQQALEAGDDAMIYMDDDAIAKDQGATLPLMLDALEQHPEAAVVTCRDIFWHGLKDVETDPLRPMRCLLYCSTIRMSAHVEVGGIDPNLGRQEDLDFAIRLRIAGWTLLSHGGVKVTHTRWQRGGMEAFEADFDPELREAARLSRILCANKMVAKFPPGVLKVTKRASVLLSRGIIEELNALYREGLLKIGVSGVEYA